MKTKNSKTSPIGINQVVPPPDDNEGWVAITLAPGKKTMGATPYNSGAIELHGNYWDRDLDADLDRLKKLGTTTLVPLIEDDELVQLKIPNLVEAAQQRDLEVRRFPFHDGGVPKDRRKAVRFVKEICDRFRSGERIVMHCNGGLGRSGTMAACVRLALGLDKSPEQAIQAVRKARGPRAIETKAQEEFIGKFVKSWDRMRKNFPVNEADRRRGAWYALAVGDALGAPVEFMSAKDIKLKHGLLEDMQAGGPWQKGEWTDDTALAIATATAYCDIEEGYDEAAAAVSMVSWIKSKPKDVGNQTRVALSLLDEGYKIDDWPSEMLKRKPGGAGNGSLMRAASTGLIRKPNDPRLIEETEELCKLTHPDDRCVGACVAYNVFLSTLVHEDGDVDRAFDEAISALQGRNREVLELVEDVRTRDSWDFKYADSPIGYVLLCLEYALAAARFSINFEGGLLFVVNDGGDTDTNAAVAGALLGAKYGFDQIPQRWLNALIKRDELDKAYGWIQSFAEHQSPEFELVSNDEPKKSGSQLLEQAKAHLPHESVGKRILVASNLVNVELVGDLQYRFTWRIAYADGREFEVGASLNGKDQFYNVDEPVDSWGFELYHRNKHPESLKGEDRLKWFTCFFVNKGMQRALQSGIYTIEAAREEVPKGE